jgi:hypothetical protein
LTADFAIFGMVPARSIDLRQKEFIFLQDLRKEFNRKEGGNEWFAWQVGKGETKKH